MEITELQRQSFDLVKERFYPEGSEVNLHRELMLIISEVSEAMEADRIGKYSVCGSFTNYMNTIPEGAPTLNEFFVKGFELLVKNTFEDELADIIIRSLCLAKLKNVDIEWHLLMKPKYNQLREWSAEKKY